MVSSIRLIASEGSGRENRKPGRHRIAIRAAIQLGLVLHAFGDHLRRSDAGHGDDGLGDRRIIGFVDDVLDEGSVDLELGDGESA